MEKKKTLAYILLIGTIIVWGISFVSMKIVLEVFSPVSLAFVRFVIATTILIVVKMKTSKERVKKEDMKLMAFTGFLAITLYFWCENNGVMRISANSSSIIIATLPIGALIADSIAYKNKITSKSILLFLAVICSSVANFAYTFAMKELDVAITSLSMNLIPVVTFLFSFIILGESLTLFQVFGAAIIIYSVYMITKPEKKKKSIVDQQETTIEA